MNLERLNQIAKAVLYEGYMLYPYRPSSVKNRQRWNFGVLYPRSYSEAQGVSDAFSLRTECLVTGTPQALLEVRLRFLRLQVRSSESSEGASSSADWQEAVEREVAMPAFPLECLLSGPLTHTFQYPSHLSAAPTSDSVGGVAPPPVRRQETVSGEITVTLQPVRTDSFKLRIDVLNTSPFTNNIASRDEALLRSLVSAHVALGLQGAEFVSSLEPPEGLKALAAECVNIGVWPVLVGEPGQHDTLLASPIILYDYPQIAPESAGDLFDGTEIDEILSLRIMTLTDDEKREIRESDERARQILERTDRMPAEQFLKLHGAVRSLRPVKESTP